MSDEMMQPKEQNKIKALEDVTCQLANTIGDILGRAKTINGFFFGVPEDKAVTESNKPELTGWFEMHTRVLRSLNDRAHDIYATLESIHEVIDRK